MSDRRPTMQDEADAQLKWMRANMSDTPAACRQVWITGYASDPTSRWWSEKPISRGLEYVSTDAMKAQIDAAVKAERARADKAEADLRVSVGGCDANAGWSHKPISIDGGKYFFCQNCGETLTKTVAKRPNIAAAIRKGGQP